MKTQFFAASGCEFVQIEVREPSLVPAARVFLSVVAVVPHEVAGASLGVEKPCK
jgi:hypothetical protein